MSDAVSDHGDVDTLAMGDVPPLASPARSATPPAPDPPFDPPSSSSAPPRLAIQRLRLENFKSYGGCVDVGPFHKSFSSIVGPNGSGKSNVIDAMLFVFGRRAKQLRHSKLSELLHHSSTYPNVQSATVTVYFHEIVDTGDGDDDYVVVQGSEFAVARRAFRNNTSKYYLNDKEVKMGEVVQLLKAKGVDLDNNRFLILQGEVEQIAMMKPKAITAHEDGLLEYLEDIIGSNKHIATIEESSRKVETLNEERGHKLNRVKVAESERDALEDAKVEAEDYLDKEREVLKKKITLGKAQQFDRNTSLLINTEKLTEASERMQKFNSNMTEKGESLKELEKTFNDTQKQSDVAVTTMNEAKDKYSAFERKDIQLREDIKALKAKAKKMKSTVTRETKRCEESAEKAEEFRREKAEAEESILSIGKILQEAETKFDLVRNEVRKKTAPTRHKLEEKQTELLPFSENVNQRRKEVDINQSELKLLEEKLEAPSKDLKIAEVSLQEMQAASQTTHASLLSLKVEAVELNKTIFQKNLQINEKQHALRQLSASCSEMRRQIEEARAASNDVNSLSRLHNGILGAARNGVLCGVVGRLGDLASIDSRYSGAVGAAAGANLDNIVVRNAENAQACIQFLRQENLGRATFVILDKINYLQHAIDGWSRSDRASDGPRLFDYLRIPNPENRTALYYAVRDTLVADSLEDARRMAFKPTRLNRVVSLSGELIESSGAMSGGGRGPSRYKLGAGRAQEAQMDPGRFQELVNQFEDAKQRVATHENDVREFMMEHRSALSRQEELQVLTTKAEVEAKSLDSRMSYMTETTLPGLQKSVANSARLIKANKCPETNRKIILEAKVATSQELLVSAREACADLESEISKLQEHIVAAGGRELQSAKEAVEQSRSELSELQSTVSKATSKAAAVEKSHDKAQATADDAEKAIENIKVRIAKLNEQSESMLDDAEQTLLRFKETEAIQKEWADKVHQVQLEYTEVKTDLKKLRREEVALTDAVGAVQRLVDADKAELYVLRKTGKTMTAKFKDLSLMSVDVATPAKQSHNQEMDTIENSSERADCEFSEAQKDDDDMDVEPAHQENSEEGNNAKLAEVDQKQLSMEIGVLESDLSKLSPNLGSIAEYQRKDTEYKSQVNELDVLTTSRDSARRECDSLRKARLDEFMAGFSVITLKLKELYQMITLGGDAELELVDSLDPFSEGIVFSVRPPKKSWKNISNLSGGEKTLSSLALVFALHHFKPTPLYFLDEIDAALDYKNVSIVANYVKERTKNAQFIIISLRNNMFELADRLVGIYKTHNTTKSVTVDPSAFVMPTAQKPDVPA